MIWVILIIIILGYLIYRAKSISSPEYQRKLKEKQIDQLEAEANYWFAYTLDAENKDLREFKNDKTLAFQKDLIDSTFEIINKLKELEKKYLTLRERFKHNSTEEKLSLVQDWNDLNQIQYDRRIDHESNVKFGYSENVMDLKNQAEKDNIIISEIIKRFDKRLELV